MSVIEEIATERARQKNEEGWSEEHDDKHVNNELAMAAAVYASAKDLRIIESYPDGVAFKDPWPWMDVRYHGRNWFKPKTRRRDLIRAAALLVAEIERLDRAEIASLPKSAAWEGNT